MDLMTVVWAGMTGTLGQEPGPVAVELPPHLVPWRQGDRDRITSRRLPWGKVLVKRQPAWGSLSEKGSMECMVCKAMRLDLGKENF